LLASLHTCTQYLTHNSVGHYQYPKNRGQIAQSPSSTPSTIAATAEECSNHSNFSPSNNAPHTPRYEECGDRLQQDSPTSTPRKGNVNSEEEGRRTGENDYMTLKADDVQRNKKEGKMMAQSECSFNKSASGLAQPGLQSPNNNENSLQKGKSNFNEEEESGNLLDSIHTM
jgi:hypothetical protein